MADRGVDLLLATLRLGGDVDVAALRRRWTALNPAGVPALVEYEGCVLWLYHRLRDLGLLDAVPAALAEWLATRSRRLAARNLRVDAQRDDLVRFHVPHVLLKGAARRLVADRFPYAGARVTSDVDVLVPQDLALPTWERLRGAGFKMATATHDRYDGHFHLPPLRNGRAVTVELHASTSTYLQPQLAWQRFHPTAQLASCQGGPTRVPAATELLWHAITHAPLLRPYGFRIRFLQDAAVVWGASAGVDWGEIAARLTSRELPRSDLARRWLGAVAQLCDGPKADNPLPDRPTFDLSRALSWRLTVFRLFEAAGHLAARPVWGPDAVSRGRRLLVDEATRAEAHLPLLFPRGATSLRRAGRRVVAGAARLCYEAWRVVQRSWNPRRMYGLN